LTISFFASLLTLAIGTVIADIAKSRAEIEGARLLVLSAALQASCVYPDNEAVEP
jgi:hypothetical protein